MYVVIKNSTKSKSYMTTDDCNKPYIVLKDGSRTPLTTNTTNGFYINIKSSSSHTESASYLTTDTESSGMSSVTALTSEVVDTYYSSKADSAGLSSTTALTRASTSGYLTRSSASGYGTSGQTTDVKVTISYRDYMSSSYILMTGDQITSSNNGGVNILYVTAANKVSYKVSNTSVTNSYGNTASQSYGHTAYTSENIAGRIYSPAFTSVSKDIVDKVNVQTMFASSFGTYGYQNTGSFSLTKNAGVKTVTTATLTRSSTYSTLTCESTSGYSGVSSSSSESTSGYSGYSSSETTIVNSALMRPLEYVNDVSTWYTSAVNSEELSSTTALTRESTSGYLTRESTSGYLTAESTTGTETLYSTTGNTVVVSSISVYEYKLATGGPSGSYDYGTTYTATTHASYTNVTSISTTTANKNLTGANISYKACHVSLFGNKVSCSTTRTIKKHTYDTGTINAGTLANTRAVIDGLLFTSGAFPSSGSYACQYTTSSNYGNGYYCKHGCSNTINIVPGKISTGTKALTSAVTTATLTCESTYSTLTCSSTSGYSGISSSGSSTWN